MNPQLQEEIFKRLDFLATKLGTTIDQIINLYIAQAKISAICTMMTMLILLSISLGCWIWVYKTWNEEGWVSKDVSPTYYGVFRVILSIVGFVTLVIHFSRYYLLLTQLFNPKLWALQEILGLLK